MSSSLATAIRGYVTVRPFGSMVIPVPVQNLVLRNFAAQQNAEFLLSINEHKFDNCFMQLFTAVNSSKKGGEIAMCSSSMLPQTQPALDELINQVIQKDITLHFVFENARAASKNDFAKLLHNRNLSNLIETSRIQVPAVLELIKSSQ